MCCICILVSCLCWNDGILVTASWDSTVKVSLNIYLETTVSFSRLSMIIFLYKMVNFFEQSRFLKRLYTFSRFHNCECVLSNSLEGLEVFSWTRRQETLAAWNPGKVASWLLVNWSEKIIWNTIACIFINVPVSLSG